jgi:hypothetical protein
LNSALTALYGEASPARMEDWFPFEKSRKPLVETKEQIASFLQSSNVTRRVHPDPWAEASKRLREDPNAALAELTSLLGP